MKKKNFIDRTRPRVCTARKIKAFDCGDVVRRLFAEQDTHGDFMIVEHVARPSAEALFDVCTDGTDLFVSVLLFDCGMASLRQLPWPLEEGVGPNTVEVLLCPYGDQLGFLQFGVGPGAASWFNHHWPYRDGRPHLAARPAWDVSFAFEQMGEDVTWIAFFRFPLAGMVGAGYTGPMGFNVMRVQLRNEEPAAWSYAGGNGFPDASSCGWLRLSENTPAPRELKRCTLPPVRGVQLQGTYDFPDEMVGGPYTPDILRHELRILKEHGFGRVYWIDYPDWAQRAKAILARGESDAFTGSIWDTIARNYCQTMRACGGDPMPVCARIAHEEGLQFFTVMKPYDIALPGLCTPRLPACGFRRNPAWTPTRTRGEVESLILFSDNRNPLPFAASAVKVCVSRDNHSYRLCPKARVRDRVITRPRYVWSPAGKRECGGKEMVRAIEITGISSGSRFLAVVFPEADSGRFGNQRYLLAEARITSGLCAVSFSLLARGRDFREAGFDFQNSGVPAGWADQSEAVELRLAPAAGAALGARVGTVDEALDGMREPSFAEVRDFWLRNWVKRAIEAGADGVDVRIAHHKECAEWLSFAFAEPVIEAFRREHGRDPEPRPEDYAAIRCIRGRFHTQFLRDAKRMLAATGKKLEAHIEARMKTPPEYDTYMQIHWDWATWIDEGIVDGLNLKYLCPFNPFVEEEILPRARQAGIPVHRIAAMGDPRTQPRTPEWAAEALALVQAGGLNGLNLYELWTYLRTTPRGDPFARGCAHSVFAALKNQLHNQ